MSDRIDSELLARYFAGTATPGEVQYIEDWVARDPERPEMLERLRDLWEAAGQRPAEWNVDRAWERTRSKILRLEDDRLPDHRQQPRVRHHPGTADRGSVRRARSRAATRTSAGLVIAIVLLVVGVVALMQMGETTIPDASSLAFRTDAAEQSRFELPDGSTAYLNAKSRISAEAGFGEGHRTIRLEGEAFFTVRPDPDIPFIVIGERQRVTVLGTEFLVSSYESEPLVVAVAHGEVSLEATGARIHTQPVLRARDVAILGDDSWNVRRNVSDLDPYLAWIERRIVFQETPFDLVISRLERRFGLMIESSIPPEEVDLLTATFSDEPIDEILFVVTRSLGLLYDREGSHVRVFRPERNP